PDSFFRYLYFLTLPFRLFKYLETEKIDTLLSFDTIPNLMSCLIPYLSRKIKIIARVSSLPSVRFSQNKLKNGIYRLLIKQLYPKAHQIIGNTHSIQADLRKNFGLNNNISVLYNPIDLSSIAIKKVSNLPKRTFTFLQVANFYSVKNHQLSIQAFAQIAHLNCQLCFVGKGSMETTIKATVERLGLHEKVHFLGYQPNPHQFMATADCLLLTSDYEGLPNVLIEALACHLPIISTDCPSGPREILAPNTDFHHQITDDIEIAEYGILTPVGNAALLAKAMQRMMTDDALGQQYRAKARKRAEDFAVEKIVAQYREVLDMD
ncbi:MAG: glycosyltransferase, partial [Bacteroidota bacterium]